tara:strand:+ start:499 stop:1617 length:1119 start_codon:yes stop_codon:yes gene_type:complete
MSETSTPDKPKTPESPISENPISQALGISEEDQKAMSDVTNQLGNVVNDVGNTLATQTNNMISTAGELAGEIQNKTTEITNNIASEGTGIIDTAVSAVGDLTNQTTEVINNTINNTNVEGEKIQQNAASNMTNAISGITGTVSNLGNTAKNLITEQQQEANNATQNITENASNMFNQIKDNVTSATDSLNFAPSLPSVDLADKSVYEYTPTKPRTILDSISNTIFSLFGFGKYLFIIILILLLLLNIVTYINEGVDIITKYVIKPTNVTTTNSKNTVDNASRGGKLSFDIVKDTINGIIQLPENIIKGFINKDKKNDEEVKESNEREEKNRQYCYVGEENKKRVCVEMYENDVCESNKIFPSKDLCINPNLK